MSCGLNVTAQATVQVNGEAEGALAPERGSAQGGGRAPLRNHTIPEFEQTGGVLDAVGFSEYV